MNSTFLTLIPKCEKPLNFADFWPISLCNLVYKIISKIATNRLKPILNRSLSANQFGFLKDRQITEPVGITQELLHSIKTKNSDSLVLKLDLVKSFDRVNWTFIRLLLIQIGIPLMGVNWIMGCITGSCLAVLVNGTPSEFFSVSRGLRQGCPLSPLLFILIMEGLSRIILDAQHLGKIMGFRYSPNLSITHLFFVDDVILIGAGTIDEWRAYKEALDLFCGVSGMVISPIKSSFLYQNVDSEFREELVGLFPFKMDPITVGFKYLGFYLKPLGYHTSDLACHFI